jgi:hypothetical protein
MQVIIKKSYKHFRIIGIILFPLQEMGIQFLQFTLFQKIKVNRLLIGIDE